VPADHVRILHSVVKGNLGSGIDLNSTSHSLAVGNIARDNGVGVDVADDLGAPATHNVIANRFAGNGYGGVVVHAHVPGGDFSGNVVSRNAPGRGGPGRRRDVLTGADRHPASAPPTSRRQCRSRYPGDQGRPGAPVVSGA
jgi:hypothetical protein